MAEAVCGWCGKPTYMKSVLPLPNWVARPGVVGGKQYLLDAPYVCANCKRMSVATWAAHEVPTSNPDAHPTERETAIWSPAHVEGQEFPDVPDELASAASEAYRCHSIAAYRGAVAIARAVVEAAAKAHNATERDLYKKIDGLYDRRLIREHIRDAAHEIRYLGNEVAHGDFVNALTKEESSEVLGLMSELLRELFQSPAQVQRRREARLAKEEAAKEGAA